MADKPGKNKWISEEDMWDSTLSSDHEDTGYLLDSEPPPKKDDFSLEVPVDMEDEVFEDAREVWDDGLAEAEKKLNQEKQRLLQEKKRLQQLRQQEQAKTPQQRQQEQLRKQQAFEQQARQTQEIRKKLLQKKQNELMQSKASGSQPFGAADSEPFGASPGRAGSRRSERSQSRSSVTEKRSKAISGGSKMPMVFTAIIVLLGFGGGYIYGNKDTLFKTTAYEFKADKYGDSTKSQSQSKVTKPKASIAQEETASATVMDAQVEAQEESQALVSDPSLAAANELEPTETVENVSGTLASVVEARLPGEASPEGSKPKLKKPGSAKLTEAEIQVALDESVIRMGQKDWPSVITLSNQIIKSNPAASNAFINRSVAYTEMGMYQEAIQDCDLVIATEPDNGIAFNNRAYAYQKKGNLSRAVQDYEKACKLGVSASCVEAQLLSSQIVE
ncbi:MAG: hypothetical protein OEZ68_15885 [Gammaproteobacteria bacterium]|nr:hypothetical protein [Gammaproteobacteria bacterium]MDH5802282.1 hypothetical protein [Gammaproteobacteria bacterium]